MTEEAETYEPKIASEPLAWATSVLNGSDIQEKVYLLHALWQEPMGAPELLPLLGPMPLWKATRSGRAAGGHSLSYAAEPLETGLVL